uniref:Mic1 domain-containing protein n=1 Tax=Kalanchoe fedtschenkoi TaxID=63787 RepID=A0A7N0ZSC7_KALFE
MFGKAGSQSGASFNGSGALSHVYIRSPPLRCKVPGSRGLYYDDGNKLLIASTSDQVFAWRTVPFSPTASPTCDLISEGPVLSIRFSLDVKVLAIQRSRHEIMFQNRETKECFTHWCKTESESILGFFWTDCPTCDIVIVKTSGLDFFVYKSESSSINLVETKRLNVNWYVYTHESRLVLLSSGMQCKNFTGFQLSSAGLIRLPKFEMVMAKSEANSKPVLAAEDTHIVTVYGRIYCLQVDKVAMLLHLYRFYRDAVVQQCSLPVYSSKISVSVIDNVLLVHQVDAKVVILYDIFGDSRAPISAPLPMLIRGFVRTNSSSRSLSRENDSAETNEFNNGVSIYGDDWTFLCPDLVCDIGKGLLWKIHLDLEAISASSSEAASMLEFLQRRKLEANRAKQLSLALARTIIVERRPISIVAKAMDVLITSYSHSCKSGISIKAVKAEKASSSSMVVQARSSINELNESADSDDNAKVKKVAFTDMQPKGSSTSQVLSQEKAADSRSSSFHTQVSGSSSRPLNANLAETDSQLSSAAVSPDEIYNFVFAPVEEEMTGDPSYLVAIIIEFLRSANLEKVKVNANHYILTVQLLARSERYSELGSFIIHKIVDPSKEVAYQLLESGRQNLQTRKLGLDMLRELSLHQDYVVMLVQDGYYLEALQYVWKYKVTSVRPSMFLEAAASSNNSQHLAAVLRFFSDFSSEFRSSAEHHTYCHILNGMNSSIST